MERPKRLTVGTGKHTIKPEFEIPIESVANKVIWANAHVGAPFNIRIGQPTPLAVFAGQESPKLWQKKKEKKTMEGVARHGRSLIVGQVIFEDDEGRQYRDVDVKGIGNLEMDANGSLVISPIKRGDRWEGIRGIFERGYAERDAEIAEKFTKLGIRTYRVLGIAKLEELIHEGKRYSIQQAKRKKIIPLEWEPVVSIRAFGTRARIDDASGYPDPEGGARLEDARHMVSQELGRDPEEFSDAEYFHWFVKTLAENVARMHKAGFIHGYLTGNNITLDCRIIDLDSAGREYEFEHPEQIREGDLTDAQDSLNALRLYVIEQHRSKLGAVEKSADLELPLGDDEFKNEYLTALTVV